VFAGHNCPGYSFGVSPVRGKNGLTAWLPWGKGEGSWELCVACSWLLQLNRCYLGVGLDSGYCDLPTYLVTISLG
jgi:hypothetical protein